MVATGIFVYHNRHQAEFQSLSGFLMVATKSRDLRQSAVIVSIPIGFSNGCNVFPELPAPIATDEFQSLSGFLMVATKENMIIVHGLEEFQSLSGFLMVATHIN